MHTHLFANFGLTLTHTRSPVHVVYTLHSFYSPHTQPIIFVDLDHNSIHVPSQEKKIPHLPEIPRKRLISRLKNCIASDVFLSNRQGESWSASFSHSKLTQTQSKSLLSKVSVSLDLSSPFDSVGPEGAALGAGSGSSLRDFAM